MKIKNKKRFIVYCVLYIIGYLFFCILGGINSGIMISDEPILEIMASSFKNARGVGGRKKTNARVCTQVNCILYEGRADIEKKGIELEEEYEQK